MAYLGSSSTASPSPSMTSSTQSTPIIDTTTNGSKMIDKISNTDMVTLNKKDESGNKRLLIKSSLYAAGLATTLTLFGLSAALLGNVFGSSGVIGNISAALSSLLFLSMGLYLLDIINIDFPSIETKLKNNNIGGRFNDEFQAFLFGATSALVASPCSSPVLTSLLAYVAAKGDATIGGIFLFTYSLGYATPVVLAGTLSRTAVGGMLKTGGAEWANSVFASLLIFYGTYSFLDVLSNFSCNIKI